MNYRIHITKTAERDVNRAVDHIEFSLKNPQAADRLMDATEHEIMSLATMPERYALVDDPLLAAWGIRFVQINNYLAFYMISKETQTVNIIRFLYGKSDWVSILRHNFITE